MRKPQQKRMEEITAEWLRARLGDDRGRKAEFSRVTGIAPDKVSKMLSGGRRVQSSEIPKILQFFGESASGVQDPGLQEIVDLWEQLTPEVRQFLRNSARGNAQPENLLPDQVGEEDQ